MIRNIGRLRGFHLQRNYSTKASALTILRAPSTAITSKKSPYAVAWRRSIKGDAASRPNSQKSPSQSSDLNTNLHSKETQHHLPSQKYLHLPHLPKIPHRPTKEELLAAATGFWSRLKLRFKWFSIRSARPWNIDDWSAFVSWFVLGNIVWILVGTTTFFSLVIFSINTVVAQGMHP